MARRALPVGPGPVAGLEGGHKALWDEYKSAQERARQAIGTNGDRLRRKRNLADYDLSYAGADVAECSVGQSGSAPHSGAPSSLDARSKLRHCLPVKWARSTSRSFPSGRSRAGGGAGHRFGDQVEDLGHLSG